MFINKIFNDNGKTIVDVSYDRNLSEQRPYLFTCFFLFIKRYFKTISTAWLFQRRKNTADGLNINLICDSVDSQRTANIEFPR